ITINTDKNVISAMQSMYNMPDGAFVYGVNPGSAAEKAGIEKGDVITKIGETEIKSYSDLTSALKDYSAGDTASVTVYRSGDYLELSITFDEYQSTIGSNEQEEEEEQEAEGYVFGDDFFQFPFGN
ncbi:MAG: PDZ domain-containing protein, partial [Oscillospiraceae bacterium]|nr:PDZ domain-containing protein [Oscillospiraceae bacterium]